MSELWSALFTASRVDLWISLPLAAVLGGIIGLERELKGKAAGLRTNILICMGAAIFTHMSILLAEESGDPTRIASQVVTGVGFLGAGSILRHGAGVKGLTTAATIWVVAAIGVAAGVAAYIEAVGATLMVVIVLTILQKIEPDTRKEEDNAAPGVNRGS